MVSFQPATREQAIAYYTSHFHRHENAESKFLGVLSKPRVAAMSRLARDSNSRAVVDFSTDVGNTGALSNRPINWYLSEIAGTRPLGSTIEKITRPGFMDKISTPAFQHLLVTEFMKQGRKFNENDWVFKVLELADHDFTFTSKMLEEIITVDGGISLAMSPANIQDIIAQKAWDSKRSKDIFSKITLQDISNDLLTPFISSITTIDHDLSNAEGISPDDVNISRVKDIVDHVTNPFVVEYAIKRSIDALYHDMNNNLPSKPGRSWMEDFATVENITFTVKGNAATSAVVSILEKEVSVGVHSFGVHESCNFLKRVSRGSDKAKAIPGKYIKQRARVLFEGNYCKNWTKFKKSSG